MQDNEVRIDGDQNKPGEVPAPAAAPETPATPPSDPTPEGPTKEELKSALDAAGKTLKAAEAEIVRLKKERKNDGNGDGNDDAIAALTEAVTQIKSDIAEIKSTGVVSKPQNDAIVTELQESRKKIALLGDALLSAKTKGTGTGTGSQQDQPPVAPKEPTMSDRDKELMDRVRARRISEGRDPETGKLLPRR